MQHREYILAIDAEHLDLKREGVSDWSQPASVTVTGDPWAPAAPGLSAAAADQAIDLTLTKPTLNEDGSTCTDFKEFEVFYSASSGIDVSNPTTYDGSFRTTATQHTFPATATTYFRACAWDKFGNRSDPSAEVSATPTSQATSVSVDDYTSNIANVYVGKGIIGIEFQPPKSSWVRWAGWKLYYDVDDGTGWTGTWTHIYTGSGPGFLHKGLTETYAYKYKLTVLGEDGTETAGTVSDNGGAGYTPNAADNSAIVGVTIFAERMIASKEMIARTFIGGKLQSLNWGASAGSQFDLDNETIKLGGSSSPKLSWDGTVLALKPGAGSEIPYIYVTGGPPTDADNTSTVIGAGLITTGRIELKGADDVTKAGITGGGTGDSQVRIWAGETYANRASAPFRVTQAGALVATNATITGSITVTGGSVPYTYVTGGPPTDADNTATVIGAGLITTGRIELGSGGTVKAGIDGAGTDDSSIRIWAGATYENRAFAPFRVTQGGALYATGATISGTVTITGGSGIANLSDAGALATLDVVGTAQIQDAAVTNAKIASLDAGKITTGTLSADRIGSKSITADKLNVSTLSAITANMGTLTAGKISVAGGLVKIGTDVYGSYDGIYVGSGGTIIVKDASGSVIFDTNSRYQGARIVAAGTTTGNSSSETVKTWSSVTVPQGKQWFAFAAPMDVYYLGDNMNIGVLDKIYLWCAAFFRNQPNPLPAGTYSNLEVRALSELFIKRDDGTTFSDIAKLYWFVCEVPA